MCTTELIGTLFFQQPGIIQVFDTFQTPNALYIVMELVEGGDLFDRIVERGQYSEDNARLVMRNVLSAVEYLHSKNIIHRYFACYIIVKSVSNIFLGITEI